MGARPKENRPKAGGSTKNPATGGSRTPAIGDLRNAEQSGRLRATVPQIPAAWLTPEGEWIRAGRWIHAGLRIRGACLFRGGRSIRAIPHAACMACLPPARCGRLPGPAIATAARSIIIPASSTVTTFTSDATWPTGSRRSPHGPTETRSHSELCHLPHHETSPAASFRPFPLFLRGRSGGPHRRPLGPPGGPG